MKEEVANLDFSPLSREFCSEMQNNGLEEELKLYVVDSSSFLKTGLCTIVDMKVSKETQIPEYK